ncbi:MAG: 30S ribosomal protein S16 [Actinobacteria bacterium]|nr:30S ribosomal protein S16 [Actinomycetota bacterium]
MRIGKKNQPSYRIIVIDKRKKRNGTYIEQIGFYNPLTNPASLQLDEKKVEDWINKGALVSDGLNKLLAKNKLLRSKRI